LRRSQRFRGARGSSDETGTPRFWAREAVTLGREHLREEVIWAAWVTYLVRARVLAVRAAWAEFHREASGAWKGVETLARRALRR
jgi:hypothetical protein